MVYKNGNIVVLFVVSLFPISLPLVILNIESLAPSDFPERTYLQYFQNEDGTVEFNTLFHRSTQEFEYEGQRTLLIIQRYQSEKSVDYDSSIVDPASLEPLAYFSNITSKEYRERTIFYKGTDIINTIIFSDSVATIEKSAPASKYFNGVIQDEIIQHLELSPGANFHLNAVNPGINFWVYDIDVTVLGKETLETIQEPIECWKLLVSLDGGKSYSTQWISVGKGILIRSEHKSGNKLFIKKLLF